MKEKLERIVQRLSERKEAQPLVPSEIWDSAVEQQIGGLDWEGREEETAVKAAMAGLYLLNDSLDASHSYAQQIEYDATGAYWHGIMHRMERDYGNSKYWFVQAGNHPVKADVKERAASWLSERGGLEHVTEGKSRILLKGYRDNGDWQPSTFVDLIAAQQGGDRDARVVSVLEQLQRIEMWALLRHTLEEAGFDPFIGPSGT